MNRKFEDVRFFVHRLSMTSLVLATFFAEGRGPALTIDVSSNGSGTTIRVFLVEQG